MKSLLQPLTEDMFLAALRRDADEAADGWLAEEIDEGGLTQSARGFPLDVVKGEDGQCDVLFQVRWTRLRSTWLHNGPAS